MADEKRVVRTAGVYGTFVLPGLAQTDEGPGDLEVTPHGVEVTFEQWMAIAEAAEVNAVVVRLDEDFPGELYAAHAEKKQAEAVKTDEPQNQEQKPATVVDGSDASTGGRRGTRNGG